MPLGIGLAVSPGSCREPVKGAHLPTNGGGGLHIDIIAIYALQLLETEAGRGGVGRGNGAGRGMTETFLDTLAFTLVPGSIFTF